MKTLPAGGGRRNVRGWSEKLEYLYQISWQAKNHLRCFSLDQSGGSNSRHPKSHAARMAKKGGVKPHMITIIMSYKQSSQCALFPFCLASTGALQLSLRSSQWHYPAEIILCPFSELFWHWAMGKSIRIDYLSCRQVWLCRRLSYWLLGWYWFPRSINNILCCYIKRTVR